MDEQNRTSISFEKKQSAMEIIFRQLIQSSNNNTTNLVMGIFDRDYFDDADIQLMANIDRIRYEKEAEFQQEATALYNEWKATQVEPSSDGE